MEIYEIDLHFHAGQQRTQQQTLTEHVEFACATGRKVVGFTDHIELYRARPVNEKPRKYVYENSDAGLLQYYRELCDLRPKFPEMRMLFAPEFTSHDRFEDLPDKIMDITDYIICELPPIEKSIEETTEIFGSHIRRLHDFTAATKKPAYVPHPFRGIVNKRHMKNGIEPWVTSLYPRPDFKEFSETEVCFYLHVDCAAVGREAAKLGVPIEINGETQKRIRAINLPAPLQLVWAGFNILHKNGAELVPGSDHNEFTTGHIGSSVPYDCFKALDISADDIGFLKKIL